MVKEYEDDGLQIKLDERDKFDVSFKKETLLTLETVKKYVSRKEKITVEKNYPVICDLRNLKTSQKEVVQFS